MKGMIKVLAAITLLTAMCFAGCKPDNPDENEEEYIDISGDGTSDGCFGVGVTPCHDRQPDGLFETMCVEEAAYGHGHRFLTSAVEMPLTAYFVYIG